jgi:hypothetical protein
LVGTKVYLGFNVLSGCIAGEAIFFPRRGGEGGREREEMQGIWFSIFSL